MRACFYGWSENPTGFLQRIWCFIAGLLPCIVFLIAACVFLLLGFLAIQRIVRILRNERRVYLPQVYLSVSTDNGNTYHPNFAAIPMNDWFYVSCDISVKEKNGIALLPSKEFNVTLRALNGYLDSTLHEGVNLDSKSVKNFPSHPLAGDIHASEKGCEKISVILKCKRKTVYYPGAAFKITISQNNHKGKLLYTRIVNPEFVDDSGKQV